MRHGFRVLPLLLLALACTVAGADVPSEEGFVDADGVRLYWHSYGEGPPLLVLNGGPGVSSTHFATLARTLAEETGPRRVILFDQRGTGRSELDDGSARTISLEAMVADIEALRKALGYARWPVMGHSWGGMYAMLYATRHPGQVEALVLSASGGATMEWSRTVGANIRHRLGPERRASYEYWIDPANAAADPDRANRARIEAMAPAYVFDPANIPFVVEALTRPGANFPAVRTLVYQDLRRTGYDLRDALAELETPALILSGRQDFLGQRVPLSLEAAIPNASLLWLEQCAHYPWLDAPAPYFSAIDGFLEGRVRG